MGVGTKQRGSGAALDLTSLSPLFTESIIFWAWRKDDGIGSLAQAAIIPSSHSNPSATLHSSTSLVSRSRASTEQGPLNRQTVATYSSELVDGDPLLSLGNGVEEQVAKTGQHAAV